MDNIIFVNILTTILFGCAIALILSYLIIYVKSILDDTSIFINRINSDTKYSYLKSQTYAEHKYTIIRNLLGMKQTLVVLISTVMLLLTLATVISCKSNYDKSVIKTQQECFDSIKHLRENYLITFDSLSLEYNKMYYMLMNKVDSLNIEYKALKKQNDSLQKSNKNLHNVIKQQNNMIQNLQK